MSDALASRAFTLRFLEIFENWLLKTLLNSEISLNGTIFLAISVTLRHQALYYNIILIRVYNRLRRLRKFNYFTGSPPTESVYIVIITWNSGYKVNQRRFFQSFGQIFDTGSVPEVMLKLRFRYFFLFGKWYSIYANTLVLIRPLALFREISPMPISSARRIITLGRFAGPCVSKNTIKISGW